MKQLIYVGTEQYTGVFEAIFASLEEAKAWQNKTHGNLDVYALVNGQIEEASYEVETARCNKDCKDCIYYLWATQ
jgi:hypothetical protein